MNKDSLTNNIQANGISPDEKPVVQIKSDKELLEDFLNELDTGDGLVSIESIEPEIRIDKFLWIIKQKEKELNKVKLIAEESITRAQSWLDKKENIITAGIEYLTGQMRNYLRLNNLKSLSLPNGNIGFRKQPDTIEIIDDTLFLEKARHEFLRHVPEKYEPNLKSIKDFIKETSEIPDGVDVKTKEDKFYYKLSE